MTIHVATTTIAEAIERAAKDTDDERIVNLDGKTFNEAVRFNKQENIAIQGPGTMNGLTPGGALDTAFRNTWDEDGIRLHNIEIVHYVNAIRADDKDWGGTVDDGETTGWRITGCEIYNIERDAIRAAYCDDFLIENCDIFGCGGAAVVFSAGNKGVRVFNSRFQRCSDGIIGLATDIEIVNNQIHSMAPTAVRDHSDCIHLHGNGIDSCVIRDNRFHGATQLVFIEVRKGPTGDFNIHHNVFYDVTPNKQDTMTGLSFALRHPGASAKSLNIHHNTFVDMVDGGGGLRVWRDFWAEQIAKYKEESNLFFNSGRDLEGDMISLNGFFPELNSHRGEPRIFRDYAAQDFHLAQDIGDFGAFPFEPIEEPADPPPEPEPTVTPTPTPHAPNVEVYDELLPDGRVERRWREKL